MGRMKGSSLGIGSCLLAIACLAGTASAAVDNVACVTWQGDPAKQHTVISGQAAQLKAVVKTTSTAQIWYKWVFGDGSSTSVKTLSGATKYNLEEPHTYTAATGTPFTAELLVADNDAVADAKTGFYLVKVEDNTLDSRVNIAIDKGLWSLYKRSTTRSDGSYNGKPITYWAYSNYFGGPTASAVLAFEVNNHKESAADPDSDPYVEVVKNGLNFLLNGYYTYSSYPTMQAISISGSPSPDTNNNRIGIEVRDYYYGYSPIYQGGQVMDAIIASGTPDKDSGRDFDGDGKPDNYKQVVQDMIDMYAWGQNGSGGWRYSWNSDSDNSACQWAAIGMIPAEREWGLTVPDFVKTLNNSWLAYSFNDYQRWFGYTYYADCAWSNCQATRPSGMVQMVLSTPNYKSDNRWIKSEKWIADNWPWFRDNTYYYSRYAFVKAMVLSETETLSSGLNWYRGDASNMGMAQRLVSSQASDGNWNGEYEPLSSAWAINMLKPTMFAASPIACFTASPNPNFANAPTYFNPSCSGHSETGKGLADLVEFAWDWDNNGNYDATTTSPTQVSHSFECSTLPCAYPVNLRVKDNSTPARYATFSATINITNPPHPPVANAGGPYMTSFCTGDTLALDGSASYDPDQGQKQDGCTTCGTDGITAYGWDVTMPLTGFNDASGVKAVVTPASLFSGAGRFDLALQVTDNTTLAYPGSKQANLTGTGFGQVTVDAGCLCELSARAKNGMVQLNWAAMEPGATYTIYRSTQGPNTGFAPIRSGYTNAYPLYVDSGLTNGKTYYYRVEKVAANRGVCGSKAVSGTPKALF